MYEAYYGLNERPFELTPNPRFLCLTQQHREALATLQYGIATARGLTLLIGEAGTGKTTLIRAALESETRADTLCISLDNPTLSRAEFVHFLADQFKLGSDAAASKVVLIRSLRALLNDRRIRGAVTVLLIDEAQSLPHELLEEVRLLANLETDDTKLLPVVLAGQPELSERLNEPQLRQLKQRVAIRCTITPLSLDDTAVYILARLRLAGGSGVKAFTREAVHQVFSYSGGIPRIINVICDNTLLAGFAREVRPVTSRLVAEVCRSLDLREVGAAEHVANPPPAVAAVAASASADAPQAAAEPTAEPDPAGDTTSSSDPPLFGAVGRVRRLW